MGSAWIYKRSEGQLTNSTEALKHLCVDKIPFLFVQLDKPVYRVSNLACRQAFLPLRGSFAFCKVPLPTETFANPPIKGHRSASSLGLCRRAKPRLRSRLLRIQTRAAVAAAPVAHGAVGVPASSAKGSGWTGRLWVAVLEGYAAGVREKE